MITATIMHHDIHMVTAITGISLSTGAGLVYMVATHYTTEERDVITEIAVTVIIVTLSQKERTRMAIPTEWAGQCVMTVTVRAILCQAAAIVCASLS